MVAAVCQFENVQSAVDTTVNVLQSCIPVAKIGKNKYNFKWAPRRLSLCYND